LRLISSGASFAPTDEEWASCTPSAVRLEVPDPTMERTTSRKASNLPFPITYSYSASVRITSSNSQEWHELDYITRTKSSWFQFRPFYAFV